MSEDLCIESSEDQKQSSVGGLAAFVGHPVVQAFSLFLAVSSVGLAFYFYQAAKQERLPRYTIVEPVKIFDQGLSGSDLKVIHASGKEIDGSLYLLQASFANDGNLPIDMEHVRRSIIFHTSCSRLFSPNIVSETDAEVSNARVQIGDDPSSLSLQWDHLDPGFEIAHAVLCESAGEPTDLRFEGRILGAELRGSSLEVTGPGSVLPNFVLGLGTGAMLLLLAQRVIVFFIRRGALSDQRSRRYRTPLV